MITFSFHPMLLPLQAKLESAQQQLTEAQSELQEVKDQLVAASSRLKPLRQQLAKAGAARDKAQAAMHGAKVSLLSALGA